MKQRLNKYASHKTHSHKIKMYNFWRLSFLYLVFCGLHICIYGLENTTHQIPNISSTSQNLTINEYEEIRTASQNLTEEDLGLYLRERMVTYCDTPNGDKGFCMPIEKCQKLFDQLENKSAESFLRASKCGPKNENKANPFVCCGKYSNYKKSDNSTETCGRQNVTIRGRILGGTNAAIGEFPWLARLYHKDKKGNRRFGCSGFLISNKIVLTAGHCLKSKEHKILGPTYEVHLGEHNINTNIDCTEGNTTCADKVQIIRVKQIVVHPLYNMSSRDHHNDIGLIYLKKGAKLSSFVSPICLIQQQNFQPFEYWLSGWGTTEKVELSHIKMKVSVPPYPHENCTRKYKTFRIKISKTQICAGGQKNRDSCTGDSGGPLMVVVGGNHWFAAGVVSYGIDCGREGWPAIYTNITSFHEWIKNTTLQLYASDKTKQASKS